MAWTPTKPAKRKKNEEEEAEAAGGSGVIPKTNWKKYKGWMVMDWDGISLTQ